MKWLLKHPWVVAAVYMAGLFALSSCSKLPEPEKLFGKDKTEHFLAYAGLAAVLFWAVRSSMPKQRLGVVLVTAVMIAAAYGATDELHQIFVPGRACSVNDWAADLLGALTGASMAYSFVILRRRWSNGRI